MEQNYKIVLSIVETIILIGKQEITLRGPISSELPTYNYENLFVVLFSGDNTFYYYVSRIEAVVSNGSVSSINPKFQKKINRNI